MAVTSSWEDTVNATGAALSYFVGQCTRFVGETLNWIPAGLGNAYEWLTNAQAKGLPTGSTPQPGAVAVWGQGAGMPFGHVAIVQSVDAGGTLTVAEENWLGQGIADTRSGVNPAGIAGYIYPPGGASLMDYQQPLPAGGNQRVQPGARAGSGAPIDPFDPFGIKAAIGGAVTSTGHGIAGFLQVAEQDVADWLHRQAVAAFVAAVVLMFLFL